MRRAGPLVLALSLFLFLALVPQACSDQTSSTVAPEADVSAAKGGNGKATLPEGAASDARINKLIQALFPQPEKKQTHQLLAQVKSALDDGDTEAARDLMFELLDLLLTTDLNEPSDITKAEAKALFSDLLFEFVGLPAPDVDPQVIQDIEDGTVDGVVAVIEGDKDNTIITPGAQNDDGETGNTGLFVPNGALPDDEDYLLVVRNLPVPCANTIFEQLPFCYEYETFPSPAIFNPGTLGVVAVCVDLAKPQEFASLIQDSDGAVAELPAANQSLVPGFTCEPRNVNITDAGSSNPIVRLARALFRPVTHLFDPPSLVALNFGMAGSIGSIDTRYVGTVPKVIAKVSGDGQTGAPGSALPSPFVVEVVHSHDGTPAVGVPVTFSVTGGGGSVSATTAVNTDANGEATTTLTLGTATGTNTVEASALQTNLTGDPADPAGNVVFTAEAVQAVSLLSPSQGQLIQQNATGIGCTILPQKPWRGRGHQIPFDWTDASGADAYELDATVVGASQPLVDETLTGSPPLSEFTDTNCNSIAPENDPNSVSWSVAVVSNSVTSTPVSGSFGWTACVLDDGTSCRIETASTKILASVETSGGSPLSGVAVDLQTCGSGSATGTPGTCTDPGLVFAAAGTTNPNGEILFDNDPEGLTSGLWRLTIPQQAGLSCSVSQITISLSLNQTANAGFSCSVIQ